jgi:hypothetical protein
MSLSMIAFHIVWPLGIKAEKIPKDGNECSVFNILDYSPENVVIS